jgi:putative CocE/NonD family hydrolase
MLVMGPWAHGAWHAGDGEQLGHVGFNQKTAAFYRDHIELPFLKHFLKGAKNPELPEAYAFETGTNQWRAFDRWPPAQGTARTLYFHGGGQLSFDPPASGEAFDEYVSDPARPVPFIPNIATGMTNEHMVDDQRFATTRPDVLVYVTEPLAEDITLAGPLLPSLHVSTTGTDADWVVKLIDVYSGDFPNPDPTPTGVQMGGYQQLVRGEVMRGKFRDSFEKPAPFVPGQVTKVAYAMPDVYHTFRRGHRIMVHVQSSWFPLVDRNPQKFMDIYHARAADFQKATQRVYRASETPSQLGIYVLPPRGA